MANSIYEATGDGSTTDFTIPYTYLEANDVTAFIGGVSTPFTFTSDNIISFVTAPANGASVRILRNTDVDSLNVTYSDGGALTAEQLNDSNTQLLFGVQEAIDTANEAMILDNDGKFQAQKSSINRVIKNVADPVNAQDAATKNYLENVWLTPSDKAQLNALNIPNLNTVANDVANVNTVATNIADVNTVATNIADVNTVAGIDTDVTTVAGISSDVTAVVADATDIGTVSTNIADVNTVAGISADVSTVAADGTDIGVVAGISSDVTTVSGIAANVTSVAGNTANINAVAADATDIGTVATNIANVNTVAGIDADVTTVAGIAADVTAAATNVADIQAISTAIADVITVANDLNEATSEIDVVANNIANVNAVGTDIANVNTVASNLADVNAFADTYFISATAPSSPTQGDLWFDTDPAALLMKVYDGSGWVNAGSSVNGTSQRVTYTATAGQTTFAATYDAGFVDVYLNGIKLIDGTDFTATSGTSIVLASGAALNDTVDIVAYGTFTLLSTVLDDLSDVSTAGATSGQVLSYNGASWSASTPSVPTLSSLGIPNHDQVTVDGSGNVDVTGTVTADGLTVDGTGGQITTDNNGFITSKQSLDVATAGGRFIGKSNRGELGHIAIEQTADGADGGYIRFSTSPSGSTSPTERLRITSGGSVGIGTSSPAQLLHVNSSGNVAAAQIQGASHTAKISTDGAGTIFGTTTNGYMLLTTNNTERLRIDSSGNVGIGTPSPARKLHLSSSSGGGMLSVERTGATTSAFVVAADSGAVNLFARDTNSGSGNVDFGFNTGSTRRMTIDSSGNVLVGTTTNPANYKLRVIGRDASNPAAIGVQPFTNGAYALGVQNASGTNVGGVIANVSSTSYATSSDHRLKENVVADWDATTRLKQLNPVRFNFIADADTTVDGFLAHEVQDVVPEAVTGTKDAMRDEEYTVSAATGDIYTPAIEAVLDEDGNEVTPAVAEIIHSTDVERPEELAEGQQWRETTAAVMGTRSVPDYQGIDQSKLVPLLVKTIQELEARIAALENV